MVRNNKGFAITGIMYSVLILFLALLFGILAILSSRKILLDKTKKELLEKFNNDTPEVTPDDYDGIPSGTSCDKGTSVSYEGLDWQVVGCNEDNNVYTLILASNYTTGAFGTTTSFEAGNNAFDQINTNFINDNNDISREIENGGIVLDSTTNTYVRLIAKDEVTTSLSNTSGTNFWTMTASDTNMWYSLSNGTFSYRDYNFGTTNYYQYFSTTLERITNPLPTSYSETTGSSIASPTVTAAPIFYTVSKDKTLNDYATTYKLFSGRHPFVCTGAGWGEFEGNDYYFVNGYAAWPAEVGKDCIPRDYYFKTATNSDMGIRPVINVRKK